MKKLLVLSTALLACSLVATTATADMLLGDIDTTPATMYSSYWDHFPPLNDTNPMDLDNNSMAAEENWLEALLGLEYNDPTVNWVGTIPDTDFPNGENAFTIDTGFDWDYAIVKAGQLSWAYADTEIDNQLVWNGGPPASSHISFFTGPGTPPNNPVPEPATMLLFGTGLIGLAGLRRKIGKN